MIKQGEIYLVNLDPTIGGEIKKTRPVIVVSNNVINRYSRVIVVVPTTGNIKNLSPSHAVIPKGMGGLDKGSKAVAEHIKSVDKQRLTKKLGKLSDEYLSIVLESLKNTFNISH